MTTTNFRTSESAYSAVGALREDQHSPFGAMIEVADRCNEVCVHCYQVQGQKGEMSTEELYSVMDQLAEMGILFLTISGGEATLRSDFLELVEYARKLRFAVKIYTNGLRVDDAMADRLAELAVQEVQISLYSPRPEVHDWVTRVPGSHQRSLAAARRLIARGVRVVLKSPVMSFNADDRGRFIDLV
ncbi:radical SAM protein, partial [bacterium]|nr:radical SAM protein [bacterium]